MSNNKQQPKPENPNNQFSNTEPLTHAQRVAIANKMSNNKQTMKLYTEEQVKQMIEKSRETGLTAEYLILTTPPTELPSDEEIDKQAEHEDTYSKKALLQEAQNGCGTEHLDATMNNDKQSSIMWLYEKMFVNHGRITTEEFEQAKAMHEEELNIAYGNGYEQGEMDFYKKMQVKGDKYAEGYLEGYKRALELVKWKIDNDLQGGNK